MKIINHRILVLIIFCVVFSSITYAETSLNLIYSIHFPDSLNIVTEAPVGDFNSDGYGDLVVRVKGPMASYPQYSAAYLYYGGVQFDDLPDLTFKGDSLDDDEFGAPRGLGDFNGDGYDDLAIGAPYAFGGLGRIYIYYGSLEPDTIPDMIIEGQYYRGGLPYDLKSGDFNGDGLSDILTATNSTESGARVFIYLGGNPPDNVPDISYTGDTWLQMAELYNSADINGDGYDDYGFEYSDWFGGYISGIYLGGDSLSNQPNITSPETYFKPIKGDLNGDHIDDFLRTVGDYWYLCLGSNPVDTTPVSFLWRAPGYPFMYNVSGLGQTIINNEGNGHYRFAVYRAMVPFNTIPIQIFNYSERYYAGQRNIGDINADGTEEIALICNDSILEPAINIYTITATNINDFNITPAQNELLSCYPNPFNSSTIIKYPKNEGVEIGIYNILGQQVKALRISLLGGQVVWNGTDNQNMFVPSGVYFARVKSSGIGSGAKLLLLR